MRKKIKYAALNMGILFMALGVLAFGGALATGGMGVAAPLSICVLLMGGIRLAWQEVLRMERQTAQQRRARRHTVRPADAAARPAPDLRVA